MKIVGSGALNLDLIYEVDDLGDVSRQSDVGIIAGREVTGDHRQAGRLLNILEREGRLLIKSGGGSAANTICALARLGFPCAFIGCTGEEETGGFILDSMKGVDCSLVQRKGRSSMCIIVNDKRDRDRAMMVVSGSADIDTSRPGVRETLSETDVFHVSSLAEDHGPDIQIRLCSMLNRYALFSFDPGEIYARRGADTIQGLLERTHLLFATDYELWLLSGDAGPKGILKRLACCAGTSRYSTSPFFRAFRPPVLAEKLGPKGARLFSCERDTFCPAARPEKIMDNTSAGDAFNAGLIAAILRGMDPGQALADAVRLAAFSLSYLGRSWIEHLDKFEENGKVAGYRQFEGGI